VLDVLKVVDARGHAAEKREYGLMQNALCVRSADAGDTLTLLTIDGQPLRHRDALGRIHGVTYDILRCPVDTFVRHTDGHEMLLARRIYLDEQDLTQANAGHELVDLTNRTVYHRSRLYRVYDVAKRLEDWRALHGPDEF